MFNSRCVREKSNVSISNPYFKFDNPFFQDYIKELKQQLSIISPKAHKLFEHIKALDKRYMEEHGKLFKHFIFCDVKSRTYGVTFLGSCFLAYDYNLGYYAVAKNSGKKHKKEESVRDEKTDYDVHLKTESQLLKTKNKNFYLLSSLKAITKKRNFTPFYI